MRPGEEVVSAAGAFVVYQLATQAAGGTNVVVPMRDHTHDLPAMAAAVTPRTRMVFIANPNNPTGTWVARARGRAFPGRPARRGDRCLRRGLLRIRRPPDLPGHPAARAGRTAGLLPAHLLQGLRHRRSAHRVPRRPAGVRRRNEQGPRTLQHEPPGAGGGPRRSRRRAPPAARGSAEPAGARAARRRNSRRSGWTSSPPRRTSCSSACAATAAPCTRNSCAAGSSSVRSATTAIRGTCGSPWGCPSENDRLLAALREALRGRPGELADR